MRPNTEIVASSARSTASAAAPLPLQIVPLLNSSLERVRARLSKILPQNKSRNVLEEAEWEDDAGDDGGFQRELQIQGSPVIDLHPESVVLTVAYALVPSHGIAACVSAQAVDLRAARHGSKCDRRRRAPSSRRRSYPKSRSWNIIR